MESSRNSFATGFSLARRSLVLFCLTVLILAQLALSVFAGVTSVNHGTANTSLKVALEVMGVSRTVGIVPPAGTDGIRYAPGLAIAATNLIEVTFVGATFKAGTTYRLCNGANQVAPATPFGSPNFNFQVMVATPAGSFLNLTNAACAATDQAVDVTLNATSIVSTATVKFRLKTSGGIILEDTSPANLAVISPKYAVTVGNSNHTIDGISPGANGTKFTTATGASATGVLGGVPTVLADGRQGSGAAAPSLRITVTGKDVDEVKNTNNNLPLGLTTSAYVGVTPATGGDFSAISKIFIADGGTSCNSTAGVGTFGNLVQSTSTSTSDLRLPNFSTAKFSESTPPGNVDFRLCVLVNGTTILKPRTIQAYIY